MNAPDTRTAAVDAIQRELTAFARRARGRAAELHPELSLVAYSILDLILERGGCQATDLAEQFLLDKSTVSRQVGALERLGYLTREVDPGNRRNHLLHATESGRIVAREAERRRREAFTERFADWTDADVTALATLLTRYNRGD
ncbi:MarR family transcriptional regulator [Nocardia sp. MH4]|jgi:DNA-binding MarR family transcriptional regulator|uniref:MarR family winged helix-turn-helix transcriptional regulator n=1 Tax=Nocardia TaxID=1817 RepID=UPI001C4F644E|nr:MULTISPECIES: MarR family transcriptional regulator [Nocardia]MBW0269881.1 MarR family transcriptional regulator [Nocardia sp. MH4]